MTVEETSAVPQELVQLDMRVKVFRTRCRSLFEDAVTKM
jgi:hypothetical protein